MIPLVFHPIYSQLSLPDRHRFPIEKYKGIRDELMRRGISASQFSKPNPIENDLLMRFYSPEYVQQLTTGNLDKKAMQRIGFPWSEQLIERKSRHRNGQSAKLDRWVSSRFCRFWLGFLFV